MKLVQQDTQLQQDVQDTRMDYRIHSQSKGYVAGLQDTQPPQDTAGYTAGLQDTQPINRIRGWTTGYIATTGYSRIHGHTMAAEPYSNRDEAKK